MITQKFDLPDVLSIPNLHACLSIFYLHIKSNCKINNEYVHRKTLFICVNMLDKPTKCLQIATNVEELRCKPYHCLHQGRHPSLAKAS